MAVGEIALWDTLYENDFTDTKPMFQVPLCLIFSISRIAFRVAEGAPISNHGARAVKLQISTLIHDLYLID